MLQRIVVASDGSERAGRAVAFAAELARRFDGALTIVHVVQPDAEPDGRAVRAQADRHGAALEVVPDDKPAEAICSAAERLDADAIVVGNLGMSGRKEFLLANVPNRISHNANRTVIIVDTRDPKERRRS